MSLSLACARGYTVKKITKVSVCGIRTVCMWVRMRRIYTKCAAYLFFFFFSRRGMANLGLELEIMLLYGA